MSWELLQSKTPAVQATTGPPEGFTAGAWAWAYASAAASTSSAVVALRFLPKNFIMFFDAGGSRKGGCTWRHL